MERPEVELSRWAMVAQQALVRYTECFQRFFAAPGGLPEDTEFALGQLHLRATCTSDTAIFLASQMKLWDAEILLRSVTEATLKFLFICGVDNEEREKRVAEYLHVLPALASLKRHRRAEECIKQSPDPQSKGCRPFRELLLSESDVDELSRRFPKDVRSRLEGKWGFTQMVEALAKSAERFKVVTAILYPYGMGSHSVHFDGDAVMMMWEREQRNPERESAIELAHGAREISDAMNFALVRTLAAYIARNLDPAPIDEVTRQFEPLREELEQAYARWHGVEYGEDARDTEPSAWAGAAE